MPDKILTPLTILALFFLSSCQSRHTKIKIIFPEGGYRYPDKNTIIDTSFFWFPLKDSMTPRDSFITAYYGPYFYGSFNEKNLSLKPEKDIVFRFASGERHGTIIILREKEIILKEGIQGNPEPYYDKDLLSEKEQWDLNKLESFFPLSKNNSRFRPIQKKYLDSVVEANPQLSNPDYYKALMEKAKKFAEGPFAYETTRIPIADSLFIQLVDSINSSGYWKQSYQFPCVNGAPTDASSYELEANTPDRYNLVRIGDCDVNDSKIAKAYQQLVDAAGMGKKIRVFSSRYP